MKNVSILDFGAAVSDRVQTAAIQNAIDACFLAGGGRVVIPCGVFLTGAVRLRSRVELYLESGAVLRGSRDPADYDSFRSDLLEPLPGKVPPGTARSADPLSRWSNGLIRAFDAEDIAVTGEKGSYFWGSDVYDPEGEEDYRGPHGFSFWNCRGVRFSGYTFLDSSNWCHALFGCQDITARNLAVYGGHDGFDVRTCDNVLIEDSLFHTGDDCIAGFDNHDVTVRNCDFQTACSVFRFGGNHVRVENCRSAGPSSFGFRGSLAGRRKELSLPTDASCRHRAHTAFNYYCDYRAEIRRTPGDILFRNCSFSGADQLILLEFDGKHRWCTNRPLASVSFVECSFEDLTDTGILWGGAEERVEYRLSRVRISCRPGAGGRPVLLCRNYKKILWEDVILEGYDDPSLLVDGGGEAVFLRSTPVRLLDAGPLPAP